jgi:hypothetical protein
VPTTIAKRNLTMEVVDGRFVTAAEPKQAAHGENSNLGTRGSNAIKRVAAVLGF